MVVPTPFVAQRDLRIRRSGTTGNNLGGVMYSDEIPETALHNSYAMVTELEAKNGVRDYIGLYLLNIHPKITAKGLVMFSPGTTFTSTDIRFGIDPQGVGDGTTFGVGQTIVNKQAQPTGVTWKNGTVRSSENSLIIPDLPPNRAIMLWFERAVVFGAQSGEDDRMPIIIDTNNIVGDTGISESEDTTTTVVTGQTDVTPELTELHNVINAEGFIHRFFHLGNCTNATDANAFIQNLAKHFLKDIMKFVFGRLDVINSTKRNQIVNGLDTSASAGYQSYNQQNVNFTILDTSKFQLYTNPSTQYNKIVSFLENANRNPNIDFIVVMMGTTPYANLPDNDPNNEDATIDTDVRKIYHSLFTKYGVHLVIGSGINNYQRHHVLGFNASTPDSPTLYFTADAPNYKIAAKQKNFGNTGSIYLNVGSGVKFKHNIPSVKTYTAFSYVPKGAGYLKLYASKRTETTPPVLEGRYYDYFVPPATPTTTNKTARVKTLIDKFTITFTE